MRHKTRSFRMQGLLYSAVQNVLIPNRTTLREGWGSLIGRVFSSVSVLRFVCWQSGTTFIRIFREHEISNFCRSFVLVVPCIVDLFYVSNQRDAVLSSLFIVLQNHSTCFGCPLHPSSGVHKTVVTTTGTSHVYR